MKLFNYITEKLNLYSDFIYKRATYVVLLFIIITGISIYYTSRLRLVSDFVDLLPQHFRSVTDLKKIIERVGGTGNLFIAIESPDVKASERFAEDVVKILNEKYRDNFRYIDYKVDDIREFYEKNAALYMSLDELEDISDRLERKVNAIKLKNNPLFVDISGALEKDARISFDDIEEKYSRKTDSYKKYIDGYYTSEEG
ncbi:MAG: hypothetical protein ACPL7I_06840, partial [Myxococcota bacterium]